MMRRLFEQFDKLVDFPHAERGHVSLNDGKTLVRIYDPHEVRREFITDAFTAWNRLPRLMPYAINAYLATCTSPEVKSHNTRHHEASLFRRLSEFMVDAEMEDRTGTSFTYYDCEDILGVIAAQELRSPEEVVRPLRSLVAEICRDTSLDGVRDPHLAVRRMPFPGSGKRTDPWETLPEPLFIAIMARATADCVRIMKEVMAFWDARLQAPAVLRANQDHFHTA
jgi:hypothetical protein